MKVARARFVKGELRWAAGKIPGTVFYQSFMKGS